MPSTALDRWSGMALVFAGISFALFMLVHPSGGVVGAEVARRSAWVPAHSFHFLGALLALFGLVGLYARQREAVGTLGLVGFIIAFIGTAMFVGTGMSTAFLWPVIAEYAPGFVESEGPMFTARLAIGSTMATYVFFAVGYVVFGIATAKARVLPRAGSWVVVIGVVLFSVPVQPVGPVPWIVRVIGAVVFGAGLAWLGHALWASGREVALG